MLRKTMAFTLATALAATSAAAQDGPDESKWFVRVGATGLSLTDKLELSLAGTPVPGADMNTKAHVTPTIQIGREISRDFAISFTTGIPPHINIDGKAVLEPFGRLAETTYGPCTLTVQYRPVKQGKVRPYLGAGLVYMIVFDADDGAFQDVEIDNDLGPVLEAGADFMVTEKLGFNLEFKKGWLRTQARGTFNNLPVVGNTKLDPWALGIGAVIRF